MAKIECGASFTGARAAITQFVLRSLEMARHPVGVSAQFVMGRQISRLQIEAAETLLHRGAELVDETGRKPIGGAQLLLAVQGARGTQIFESIIALCRIGRGVPASMLNRALLEDALDVHWVAANPDIAPGRADEHEQLIRLAERATEARFGRPTRPLSSDEEERLSVLRSRFKNFKASWTLSSVTDRLALVKQRWGPESEQNLEYTYEVIQRQNNVLLHPSPSAYGLAMTPGRKQINRMGPDPRWPDALAHGLLGYYLICRVLAEEFNLNKEPVADAFGLGSCFFKAVPLAVLEECRPGEQCPCGSGRRVGQCHGPASP